MSSMHGLSLPEMIVRVMIGIASHCFLVNNLLLAFRYKQTHVIFLVTLKIVSSLMYHLCVSTGQELLMEELSWLKVNNVATICGMMEIFNYFQQVPLEQRLRNSWAYFMIAMILQDEYCWEVWATVLPIVGSGLHWIANELWRTKKKKATNRLYLRKGGLLLSLALLTIYFGLDEQRDSWHIFRSLCHTLTAMSFFYLNQIYEGEVYSLKSVWSNDKLYIKL